MAEELEEVHKKFNLSDKEAAGIQIEGDDAFQGVEECQLSIIGKVIGDKVANVTGIKRFSSNVWIFAKNVKVVEIGVNLFQFIFMNQYDMDRVLNGRPWVYDNLPLVVIPWKEGVEMDAKAFSQAWIWVQVWNLPIHWITKEVGRKIGGVFLSVKEVIIPNSGGKDGKHLKILVEIDIEQPLLRGTTVRMNGVMKWIEFRYEKCPDFCYCCGKLGHNEKNCNMKGNYLEKETQFGAWMRASNARSPKKHNQTYAKYNEGVEEVSRNNGKGNVVNNLFLAWGGSDTSWHGQKGGGGIAT
ncbi:uncharacterized protein LOC113782635 [Coffea eugenioides]|uniref:CCHC-type domain-containing protein n=1 Tax=Coffea arabica TaxID=13443 RepID=A0ABM4W8W3_COFAR|nr:uncharacterized protein LOC113782635 [Coffea eugenioides]